MPAVVWKSARHSKGRGVLVGEPVRTLENFHFLGVLVEEPIHHTQAAGAHSGMDACRSVDAVVRMPVRGTVHVTMGGELAPGHLPQCALGPSVTGHGAPLTSSLTLRSCTLRKGSGPECDRVWGPPAAEHGRCNQGKADRAHHKWRRAQKEIAYHRRSSQVGLGEGRPSRARGPAIAPLHCIARMACSGQLSLGR